MSGVESHSRPVDMPSERPFRSTRPEADVQDSLLPGWIRPRYAVDEIWLNADFQKTSIAETLSAQPMGFVDVGARGGVHDLVAPLAAGTAVLAFEPDARAFEELTALARSKNVPWARMEVMPVALAERRGPGTLYLCSAPTNHSLRPVNL